MRPAHHAQFVGRSGINGAIRRGLGRSISTPRGLLLLCGLVAIFVLLLRPSSETQPPSLVAAAADQLPQAQPPQPPQPPQPAEVLLRQHLDLPV
eukprot:SAG22_NODE_8319_length_665_cov_0.743816_1_plen_93_part_10